MVDFWKMPIAELDDLGDPGDEKKAAKAGAAARSTPEARVPPVAWPPVCPKDLESPEKPVGPPPPPPPGKPDKSDGAGRGANRRRNGKGEGTPGAQSDKGNGGAGSGGGKRDDGWLPKAEYEAKKREERARKHRERQQGPGSGGGGGGDQGSGKDGSQGRGGQRGGWGPNRDGWQDVMMTLPKRPPPVQETAEIKASRAAEEAKLRCRDELRAAATPEALRRAIATAKELRLTEEVKAGERKLAKMEGAA